MIQESKRQKQVARLIQEELSDIFKRENMSMAGGGMVSISSVSMTPDLLEARVYLSFFQVKDNNTLLQEFIDRTGEWRHELGNRVRHQLRRVPELSFFLDDTLDYVFHMEKVFSKLKADEEAPEEDAGEKERPEEA